MSRKRLGGARGRLGAPLISSRKVEHDLLEGSSSLQFVLNIGVDYSRKIGVGAKPEALCPRRVEISRPAGDDFGDRLIGLPTDEGDGLLARDGAQSLDLLADRHADARQSERPAGADEGKIELRSPQQELDRRPGRGVPVADLLVDRQDRLLARKRLADDAGEKAGGRLVGRAGAHADRRQAQADSVEEPAPRVVREQEFADRLLGPVACQRRAEELVADLVRKRGAKYRDRVGEDESRPVSAAGKGLLAPDRLEYRVG